MKKIVNKIFGLLKCFCTFTSIMTKAAAKKKAKELVESFKDFVAYDYRGDEKPLFECQRQCAIIAVNEIISVLTESISPSVHGFLHKDWQLIKKEIINLK